MFTQTRTTSNLCGTSSIVSCTSGNRCLKFWTGEIPMRERQRERESHTLWLAIIRLAVILYVQSYCLTPFELGSINKHLHLSEENVVIKLTFQSHFVFHLFEPDKSVTMAFFVSISVDSLLG